MAGARARPFHEEAHPVHATLRTLPGLPNLRLARAVNRAAGRSGRVWADRYHTRALTTPREVRNALVYVLTNYKKHGAEARGIDLCSSAAWFDGGKSRPPMPPAGITPPIVAAQTWLLRAGWHRHGMIALAERPKRL